MERKIFHVVSWLLLFVSTLHETTSEELLYCPEPCLCRIEGMSFIVDCSGQELSDLPTFHYKNVQYLDLSKNLFTKFPEGVKYLEGLEVLDISWNLITTVPATSLDGLISLRVLDLGHNNIANWIDINPNTLLMPAFQLRELSLAGNKLSSFTSLDDKLILMSSSLERLDLSHNKIAKITGEEVLQGLTSLRKLKLSGNSILSMVDLVSNSLLTLDLSSCDLGWLKPTFLSKLPMLISVDLSKNSHLTLIGKDRKFVTSDPLREIDLSFCNQEHIQLEGFPNLTFANLSHNMVKELSDKSFTENKKIEVIELAMNMIGTIHPLTFKELTHLKSIDLSFNSIQVIDRNLFKDNLMLIDVNLSYNYINRLIRLNAPSLAKLNLSHCEVLGIERNVLEDMKEIIELDLSYNILPDFPPYMDSHTLRDLNLKNNRITTIRNTSFMNLPSLTAINFVGNRLTTPLKRTMFSHNHYLQEIWLGDNPWICNCDSKPFHDFYRYLTEPPRKAYDLGKATCYSPEHVYGLSWETACYKYWYPHDRYMGNSEKIWVTLMVAIIVFAVLYCVFISVKKQLQKREERRAEEEREGNETEAAAIARQTRMRLQQEAQLNAPDPRDTHPPCYEDAIRMPKPFFYSMDELSTTRKQKRRKRGLLKQDNEDTEETTVGDSCAHHRFHSEEVLSSTSRAPPRLHPFELEALERNRPTNDTPLSPNSEHILEQIEEILIFNSRQNSPYSRRRASSGSRSRRHGSSGSIHRSKDSFQRIGSLKRLTEKPEPSAEDISSATSASSLSNNFVEVKPAKKGSTGSSRLEMTDEAGKCLEEEVKLLEEVEKLKKMKKEEYSDSSSDSEGIEVIQEEEVARVDRGGAKAEVEVHRRGSNFNK